MGKKKEKPALPGGKWRFWCRLQYVLLLLLCIGCWLFYQNYAFFVCMVCWLLLPGYARFAQQKTAQSMKVELSFSHQVTEQDSVQKLNIRVSNKSRYPAGNLYLLLHIDNGFYPNQESYTINLPVYGKGQVCAQWELDSSLCGMITAEIEKVYLMDMLNLRKKEVPLKASAQLYVMPGRQDIPFSMEQFQEISGEEEEMEIEKGDDPSILLDIRSYIPGDRMQRIHWKLTARQDEFMVKEYGQAVSKKMYLLVDLFATDTGYPLDFAIQIFYNLSLELLNAGEQFEVCWFNETVGEAEHELITSERMVSDTLWQIYQCRPYSLSKNVYESYKECINESGISICYLTLESVATNSGGDILHQFGRGVVLACLS